MAWKIKPFLLIVSVKLIYTNSASLLNSNNNYNHTYYFLGFIDSVNLLHHPV
jgi:hypothetical protein